MRIEPRPTRRKDNVVREVRRAHTLGPMPDPVCCPNCPDHGPLIRCHRFCPAAPRRLSSEGERGPVEPLVAPLVFELKKLGVFYPCWSCEGHEDQNGQVRNIPRVWFYADLSFTSAGSPKRSTGCVTPDGWRRAGKSF